jgi:hypothetical protein
VGTKTVKGLTLQQPPNQPNGGGLGSSLSVVTPVGGLGPGQTLNVAFQFHTVRTGSTRVNYIAEAITTP